MLFAWTRSAHCVKEYPANLCMRSFTSSSTPRVVRHERCRVEILLSFAVLRRRISVVMMNAHVKERQVLEMADGVRPRSVRADKPYEGPTTLVFHVDRISETNTMQIALNQNIKYTPEYTGGSLAKLGRSIMDAMCSEHGGDFQNKEQMMARMAATFNDEVLMS